MMNRFALCVGFVSLFTHNENYSNKTTNLLSAVALLIQMYEVYLKCQIFLQQLHIRISKSIIGQQS